MSKIKLKIQKLEQNDQVNFLYVKEKNPNGTTHFGVSNLATSDSGALYGDIMYNHSDLVGSVSFFHAVILSGNNQMGYTTLGYIITPNDRKTCFIRDFACAETNIIYSLDFFAEMALIMSMIQSGTHSDFTITEKFEF